MSNSHRLLPITVLFGTMALAFIGGMWLSSHQRAATDGSQIDGLLWPNPPTVQPFHLIDHHNQPFTIEQLRGRWSLIFFGFTNCPDICPTTLDAMARAHSELQGNAIYASRGQVIFVSVDPERDSPAALTAYVQHFSPDFIAATSGVEELKSFANSLGALFMRVEQSSGVYTMDHSAGIFFVSPELHLVSVLTPPHNAAEIALRLKSISAFVENNS